MAALFLPPRATAAAEHTLAPEKESIKCEHEKGRSRPRCLRRPQQVHSPRGAGGGSGGGAAQAQAKARVEVVRMIAKHLRKGERVKITGLGILQVRKRAARMGRNPATGETIQIKASKKVAFRATKDLKEAI